MAQAGLSESTLKKLLKEALTETLQEQREFLHDVFAEVLEDIALRKLYGKGSKLSKWHARRFSGLLKATGEDRIPQEF